MAYAHLYRQGTDTVSTTMVCHSRAPPLTLFLSVIVPRFSFLFLVTSVLCTGDWPIVETRDAELNLHRSFSR